MFGARKNKVCGPVSHHRANQWVHQQTQNIVCRPRRCLLTRDRNDYSQLFSEVAPIRRLNERSSAPSMCVNKGIPQTPRRWYGILGVSHPSISVDLASREASLQGSSEALPRPEFEGQKLTRRMQCCPSFQLSTAWPIASGAGDASSRLLAYVFHRFSRSIPF